MTLVYVDVDGGGREGGLLGRAAGPSRWGAAAAAALRGCTHSRVRGGYRRAALVKETSSFERLPPLPPVPPSLPWVGLGAHIQDATKKKKKKMHALQQKPIASSPSSLLHPTPPQNLSSTHTRTHETSPLSILAYEMREFCAVSRCVLLFVCVCVGGAMTCAAEQIMRSGRSAS